MKNYIIYEITNKTNGKKYVGCHITKDINDTYMGSGKYLKNAILKYGIENFEKIILYFCDNEEEMLKKEREIVNEEIVNSKDYYNLTLGGGKTWYHINKTSLCRNKVMVKDKNNKTLKVSINDEKYLNGEYKSIMKDKILCKDNENNFYWIYQNDQRYLKSLIPINKGLILVKDREDKILLVSKDDERYLNGELKCYWTGKKHSEETKKKIGIKNSIKQKGEKNSQFGTCWIINENEKKCIKINNNMLDDYLLKGWKKGRKMNW